MCYSLNMSKTGEISLRELRNDISEVLRRVEAGERLRVTVDRRAVAQLVPLPHRREAVSFGEYAAWRLAGGGADADLARELAEMVPDTTDDL